MEPTVLDAPVVADQPVVEQGLPPMSEGLRAAFANPQSGSPEPPPEPVQAPAATEQPAAPASSPSPAAPASPSVPATDYAPWLKETFGVETPEALKEKLTLAEQAETLKANQRDAHDIAIRQMLTTEPEKAEAYFALQRVNADALATGTPEQQRRLLFESYKVANPALTGRLAELGFNKEFTAKYALMDSDDPDEAEDAEFAKLQYQSDLSKAVPAIKSAQEAAKIAVLPTAEANGPTKAELEAFDLAWLNDVEATLKAPVGQSFQVEGVDVNVDYEANPTLKDALVGQLDFVREHLTKVLYPNGVNAPADHAALARTMGSLLQPDAIAKAAFAAGKASVGAHVPMERLVNPAPDAPQPGASGGEPDRASVLSKMRAVSTGRF